MPFDPADDPASVGRSAPHTRRATTATVPPRPARPNANSAATATGTSGRAAAVTSASRLRKGALRYSAW